MQATIEFPFPLASTLETIGAGLTLHMDIWDSTFDTDFGSATNLGLTQLMSAIIRGGNPVGMQVIGTNLSAGHNRVRVSFDFDPAAYFQLTPPHDPVPLEPGDLIMFVFTGLVFTVGGAARTFPEISRVLQIFPPAADLDPVLTAIDTVHTIVDDIAADVPRILGLTHENMVIEYTWDGNNMVGSIIFLYDSAVNAAAHDGVTGLIERYEHEATYDGNRVQLNRVVRT